MESRRSHSRSVRPGSRVWIPVTEAPYRSSSTDCFVQGTALRVDTANGTCAVTLDDGATVEDLVMPAVALANPEGMVVPDCCQLLHTSEATVLSNLHSRFAEGQIYTSIGTILLAIVRRCPPAAPAACGCHPPPASRCGLRAKLP